MIKVLDLLKFWEDKYVINKDGSIYSIRSKKYLKPIPKRNLSTGNIEAYRVSLPMPTGSRKGFKVHRLVAYKYIPNPLNKPQIDHIDRDVSNNDVSNLRWVTNYENQQNRDGLTIRSKKVRCIETGEVFASIRKAAQSLDGNWRANEPNIRQVLNKKSSHGKKANFIRKKVRGYSFEYAERRANV